MVRRNALLVLAGLGLLAGCGDEVESKPPASSGRGSCQANVDFVACGGDIEGRWALRTGCTYMEAPQPWGDEEACQDVPSSFAVTYTSGAWEFRADGTSSTRISVKIEETAYFDDACLLEGSASPNPSQACHEWEGPITEWESDSVTGHNVCEYANGICTCVASMNEMAQPETSGRYEVVGSEIRLDGAPAGFQFCRSGDSLEIQMTVPGGITRMVWERDS